jgi:hypothetical protein
MLCGVDQSRPIDVDRCRTSGLSTALQSSRTISARMGNDGSSESGDVRAFQTEPRTAPASVL